jgi:gliding motility-associated-like protein
LTVEDQNNCVLQYTGIVGSIDNLSSEIAVKDARCFGEASGMAQVFVATGNPPYTYEWSNGAGNASVEDLTSGNYTVLISDLFGCTSTHNFTINQPDSFYVVLSASDYVNGYNLSGNESQDGWISAAAFGGTFPYSYLWSTGDTTASISGLTSGIYTILVEDNNGCIVNGNYRLTEPGVLEMPTGYSPNGDLRNDFFVIHGLDAYPDNKLIVFNRWGNIVYEQTNYINDWNGENNSGEEIPDGTYFALLTVYGKEEITLKGYVDLRRK